MKNGDVHGVSDLLLVSYWIVLVITNVNAEVIESSNHSLNQSVISPRRTSNQCPPFSRLLCPTPCDPTCKRPLSKRSSCPQPITCPEKVCVCNPDFVRDDDGQCIPAERCSEKCPENEIYKLCPASCEIHCGNINNAPKKCPEDEREDHECIADCVCPSGSIRDYFTKKCVRKDLCSSVAGLTSCPPNEEYLECVSSCEKICNKEPDQSCSTNVCRKGCFCKSGFIRQNENGQCIPDDKCFIIIKDTEQWTEQDVIDEMKKFDE